ncbi:hypothetical protein [Providencia rustigianii]|uniref:hypothetical protein n=1 Tax=Providencia rustigianii TaxID=158850 RepID=UPI00223EF0A4|nr:hypothetical protein [Providencia rustigianii]
MKAINTSPQVQIRRMSVTDQQGKTTEFTRTAKSVKNDSQQHPQVTTDKKTVHLKDIAKLRNNISTGLKNIHSAINDMLNPKTPAWKHDTSDLNKYLSVLKNSINEYQKKLDNSSYNHHQSKQEALTKLNGDLSKIQDKLIKVDSIVQSERRGQEKIKIRHDRRHMDFLNGKKDAPKFDY